MNKPVSPAATIRGEEHWTNKGSDVRLFLWNKNAGDPSGPAGRILFVHGSSMASQPTFDLQGGRADATVMDFFAARGYDTWCVDMEGYGRSTKTRDHNAPTACDAAGPAGLLPPDAPLARLAAPRVPGGSQPLAGPRPLPPGTAASRRPAR